MVVCTARWCGMCTQGLFFAILSRSPFLRILRGRPGARRFSVPRVRGGSSPSSGRRRSTYYSAYSWGLPSRYDNLTPGGTLALPLNIGACLISHSLTAGVIQSNSN